MDATNYFPSKWLRAEDINGDKLDVEISKVTEETIDENKRLVVHFTSLDKGLVLNKTNYKKLLQAFGKETDDWVGNAVKLYTAEVSFKGEEVLGIRIQAA